MRQGQNLKRPRGQRRKHNGGANRTMDSTGPDIKIRGSSSHIYEKYLQLSRDSQTAGDRIKAENYLQHAEHYFRLMRAAQPAAPVQQPGAEEASDAPSVQPDAMRVNGAAEAPEAASSQTTVSDQPAAEGANGAASNAANGEEKPARAPRRRRTRRPAGRENGDARPAANGAEAEGEAPAAAPEGETGGAPVN
ncbi:MAG: DUF4167 domain-containing protein [Pseudomonadota bacterium]